ncbi:serine hydrolase [Marinicella sp. S1101]|uniref:serine hydrolase domain-containing protein n=1 Tax=Marinicella marina TaxID=2996016 RepID=UPI0022609D25|nr:serine hydrolase [Marinicella marina]MCX7554368.1 serine hydrolase [Marinicella marina]MDJ1138641.1 serine hydrolase [Marinicella marina]
MNQVKYKGRNLALIVYSMLAVIGSSSLAANNLDDAASDPQKLGMMQGFPPPVEKRVMQPDSNFFSFPKMRWTVCHIRELMPTKQVSRGLGNPVPLPYQPDPAINDVTFKPIGKDTPMSWQESLAVNYTDGMLIMHQGKVVYEYYSGCLDEAGKHAAMSMTKSMTGLLAEVLIAEGALDENVEVATLIPELSESAFGDATVREVMDMTTSLDYSEDYSDPKADIWVYSAAANPMTKPPEYKGPVGYYEYLQTVKAQGSHGQGFAYKTINTDTLGWIIARTSGQSVADLFAEKIWRRIGAEQDAYFTVDAIGTPFAGGGLSAGLRDLGRVGLLMLNEGQINGQQVVPSSAIQSIKQGADKDHFAQAGYGTLPGGSY